MAITFSETQERRLRELGVAKPDRESLFETAEERDREFQRMQTAAAQRERARLLAFRQGARRPKLCLLQERLAAAVAAHGFVQVTTPILLSRKLLGRMGIDEFHPLNEQIYWVGRNQCLRPMLAPHLYYVVKDLLRQWEKPVGLFEVGPCFRKESEGASHSSEFTMLNLAEFGTPMDERHDRLREMAAWVMEAAGIEDYRITTESSEVYGETMDVEAGPDSLEVASCALGPHFLDAAWEVMDTWVGLGFGLERLLMVSEGSDSMGRLGRSLSYLDGIRLNV